MAATSWLSKEIESGGQPPRLMSLLKVIVTTIFGCAARSPNRGERVESNSKVLLQIKCIWNHIQMLHMNF